MAESKHTPHWKVGPSSARDEDGEPAIGIYNESGYLVADVWGKKSAERILASPMACAGMTDPQAEMAGLRERVVSYHAVVAELVPGQGIDDTDHVEASAKAIATIQAARDALRGCISRLAGFEMGESEERKQAVAALAKLGPKEGK